MVSFLVVAGKGNSSLSDLLISVFVDNISPIPVTKKSGAGALTAAILTRLSKPYLFERMKEIVDQFKRDGQHVECKQKGKKDIMLVL